MATQEELAALFNRNLSLHPQPIYTPPPPELNPAPVVEEPYVYSITQHYNHSSHIARAPTRPASEPPQTELLTVELVLAKHGVDPTTLYPSQIDLFRTADEAQQMRLIELWRICPPEYSSNVAQTISHSGTSLQQEEALAKMRYERIMLEERMSRTGGDQAMDSDTMSDASTNQPLTPIQGGDGRWANVHAEPYMSSGYELLAAREYEKSSAAIPSKDIYSHYGTALNASKYSHATDPVYNTSDDSHGYPNVGGDWQRLIEQKRAMEQQAMENQYGAFEQRFHQNACVRNGGDEEML